MRMTPTTVLWLAATLALAMAQTGCIADTGVEDESWEEQIAVTAEPLEAASEQGSTETGERNNEGRKAGSSESTNPGGEKAEPDPQPWAPPGDGNDDGKPDPD